MENQENNQDMYSYQSAPSQEPNQKPPQNTMATVAFVISIFGFLSCCIPPLQFILGMAGLLLAIFSKKGKPFSGFAVAGLVLSILSLLISIGMIIYMVFVFNMMKDPEYAHMFNEIMQIYEQAYETMPVQ